MTKMHYARFAKMVQVMRKSVDPKFSEIQLEAIADQIALACAEFNPKFDYLKFEDACHNSRGTHN